jgi:ABC-type dipeptide/oligopeptide/nickel transport system permease subunit
MIGRVAAAAYVATVAGLTAAAFSSTNDLWWAEISAAILTLPMIVVALPGIYVVGAFAWSLVEGPATDSSSSTDPVLAGNPIWPVTLTFTVMMTLVACANIALAHWALSIIRARRAPSGSAVGGASSPGHPTRGAATTPRRPGPAAR